MNPAVATLTPSLIRTLHARRRPGDIDLGLGQPEDRPDVSAFEAATRWVAEHGCPYTPNAGFDELRQAVVDHLGVASLTGPGNVVITHGSQEAVYLVVKALLDPARDEVLIAEPTYGAYAKLCQLEGLAWRTVAFSDQVDFEPRAETVLGGLTERTRLVILASPVNPTGRVWSEGEARALAEALASRPGPPTWLLVDAVYSSLCYVPGAADFAALYPHTLVAGGLSKSHALTGLRLGWLAGPSAAIAAAVKVHQQVSTAASTFSQRVALEIMARPGSFLESQALWLGRRGRMCDALVAAGLSHAPMEGAFYSWIRLPERWRDRSLDASLALLEQARVVTVPGVAFGEAGEGWLRLSYAGNVALLHEGVARVAAGLLE